MVQDLNKDITVEIILFESEGEVKNWQDRFRVKNQWMKIIARGPGLTLGEKCAIIDDGEYVYHGLLPIQETDEEGVYECTVDFWEENKVWKALQQQH